MAGDGGEGAAGAEATTKTRYLYFRELLNDGLLEEVGPLLRAHWVEIAHYPDIPLDPDFNSYRALEAQGNLRVFTARDALAGMELVGYACFIVRANIHYRTSLQAVQDVLYIRPDRRGFGRDFISWCDEELRKDGVQVVYHHVKLAHDWGRLLERLGYERIETIWGRRLDR